MRTEHTLEVVTQPRSLVGGSWNGSIPGSTVHAEGTVRWEKYPQTYEAFLHLACALLCFQQCDRAQAILQAKVERLSLAA